MNYLLISKRVKIRASIAVNSLFIGQSTLATIIDRDLLQFKLGPKTVPKKGIRPLKLTVACLILALGALKAALKAAPKAAPKATLKAAVKGAIENKSLPKARTTPLK